jgi:polyisoprenyl-teichoic acid--peptidoglycan teichoic acid transferase
VLVARASGRIPMAALGGLLLASVLTACSGSGDAATTTTTTAPPATTTTTTRPATTTTAGNAVLTFPPDLDPGIAAPVIALYAWLSAEGPAPDLPDGLSAHLAGAAPAGPAPIEFAAASRLLTNGDSVAVLQQQGAAAADTVLLVDDGGGWRIVGAAVPGFGRSPWYGDPVRKVLVLGSDAQYGEDQTRLRADSIHIVTAVPDEHAGAILGFPRDSWVDSPYGRMKINAVMANRGPEAMVDTIEPLTGIDMDGYVVTGFTGFVGLVTNFGGLTVDLPERIRSGVTFQSDYPAGEQTLDGDRLLWLARVRKTLADGDFGRSENQGLIMTFALEEVQRRGILDLPWHLENLLVHTWTDLSTEELLTLGATAYEIDPALVVNEVVPGRSGTAGSASVVYLSPSAGDVYRDLDDGILGN